MESRFEPALFLFGLGAIEFEARQVYKLLDLIWREITGQVQQLFYGFCFYGLGGNKPARLNTSSGGRRRA
jgi:hypothetical protein